MTKNEFKYYSSLLKKKQRDEENKFLVEGKKIVEEGFKSEHRCEIIFATQKFFDENEHFLETPKRKKIKIEIIKNGDFEKLTDTITPQGIAAVFYKLQLKNPEEKINAEIVAVLENISDPGNVGTIIRNCDWFGIKEIILSAGCADVYNPKTLRACMGSVFHLDIYENVELISLNKMKKRDYQILCADLNGMDITLFKNSQKSLVIFANEANGPSQDILNITDKKITIPKFGAAESLNVASASAVILAHLKLHC